MADILSIIKRAAIEAVESRKPVRVCFGQVTQVEPPAVRIDQKITIQGAQLVVPEAFAAHEREIEIDDETDFAGDDLHSHALTGAKRVLVKSELRVGDGVILLRADGGQRYVVIGRVAA